jgi:hypothetical protein
MGGKKVEGNEEQKRRAASKARRRGKRPSEMGATTGAAQQRAHLGGKTDHQEKLQAPHRGQQTVPPPKSKPPR